MSLAVDLYSYPRLLSTNIMLGSATSLLIRPSTKVASTYSSQNYFIDSLVVLKVTSFSASHVWNYDINYSLYSDTRPIESPELMLWVMLMRGSVRLPISDHSSAISPLPRVFLWPRVGKFDSLTSCFILPNEPRHKRPIIKQPLDLDDPTSE